MYCRAARVRKRGKVGRPKKLAEVPKNAEVTRMTAVLGRRRGRPRKVWNV